MAESVEMVEDKGRPPVFCEKFCIVCKGAREGNKICKTIQNIELKIFGKNGCIWGAARTKYYGVTPDKKLPGNSRKYKKQVKLTQYQNLVMNFKLKITRF